MRRFFSYDNSILRKLGKVGDVIYLSAFWTLFSIPVFTMGASTTALYYAINKALRHNRGYSWGEFMKSFKTNFKQSTRIWLVVMGIYLFSLLDCFLVRRIFPSFAFADVLFAFFVALMILVTMWVTCLFPYIARFENTSKAIMKNCALIAITHFPRMLLLLFLLLISIILFFIVPLAMLFVPGIYMFLANRILEPVFCKYMTPEDLKAEEERNSEYIEDHFGEKTQKEDRV